MSGGEIEFVRWLQAQQPQRHRFVKLGIGDDMAIASWSGTDVLVTTDMLLDGVHFSTEEHRFEAIGRKAIACSLSDCAAMAVEPVAATVSVALSDSMTIDAVQRLFVGAKAIAEEFDCAIAGGDTTRWPHPLVIDVCMIARPYDGIAPVTRSGAEAGDVLVVTGPLGGSLRGRHLTFTPRVREARKLAEAMGAAVHALMDISDGLSLDLYRLCEASGVGAELDEGALGSVISDDARAAAGESGRTALEHALEDGEDFELLAAIGPEVATPERCRELGLYRIGVVTEGGLTVREATGRTRLLTPRGYDHLDGADRAHR